MVFVVVAYVVHEDVQGTVVTECLWNWDLGRRVLRCNRLPLKDVVFSDEMRGTWMQTPCQKRAQNQIPKRVVTPRQLYERVIEDQLDSDIEGVDFGERDLVDHHGAEGVEEDLEGAEEGFACDGIEEEGFEASG